MGPRSQRFLLLATLVLLVPLEAEGASPRYATLFAEEVDGRAASTSSAELALTQTLIQAGLLFVDEAQSRRIRSVTTAGRILADGIPEVVTGLDADLLIVGVTRVQAVKSRLLKGRAVRMEAATEAKLIAVDSGEVLAAFTTRGSAVSLVEVEAARKAAEQSGRELAKALQEVDPKRGPKRLEVTIEGELDLTALDGLVAHLRAMPEVEAARVLHAGEQTKIEVVTGAPAQRLAGRLDRSLKVTGFTKRSIRAAWIESPPPASTPRTTTVRAPAERRTPHQERRPSPVAVELGFESVIVTAPRRSKQNLTLRSTERLEDVELSAKLERHGQVPTVIPVGRLAPNEPKRIPLTLSIDRARAARIDRSIEAVLVLVVSYRAGGQMRSRTFRRSVTLQDKNAIDWADDTALAAFVTHESGPIRRLGAGLVQRIDPDHPLSLPAAAFVAMRNVRPVPDPSHPYRAGALDYVQFPAETLRIGSGDCDDLAALYAALLESVGRRAAFLFVPGHVFVAVDTGLYLQAYRRVSPDRDRLIVQDGRVWLPLETSDPGRTFAEAWDRAVARIAQTRNSGKPPRMVEVRRAWSRYPPVDLGGQAPIELPHLEQVARQTARALVPFDQRRTRAARDLEAELRAAPSARRHLERGLLAVAEGDLDRAETAFRAALELDSGSEAARTDLAALRLARGELEAAEQAHERLRKEGLLGVESALNAALTAWATGDKASFAERISDALEAAASDEDQHKVRLILEALEPTKGSRGSDSEDGTKLVKDLVFWR